MSRGLGRRSRRVARPFWTGQYLVVPSRRILVVRRGYDGPGTGFDIEAFSRDLLAALGERNRRRD